MLDSIALNVVISLVFIYLLYSMLVTTINEGIANSFRLRAKTLEKGIMRMLTDDDDKLNTVFTKFYKQPIIKYLAEDNTQKPSYLNPTSFSKALIDLCKELSVNSTVIGSDIKTGIEEIKKVNPETGKYLESLLEEANNDVDEFRALAENWFDETMDRATGWYKRQTQKITLLVAFVISVSFNVDTISIANKLSSDPELASKVAALATKYTKENETLKKAGSPKATDNTYVEYYFKAQKETADANSVLGLGLSSSTDDSADSENTVYKYLKSILGWVLTTLAISLGAPFWFDLLNKFMLLRGSKTTEDSEAEKN